MSDALVAALAEIERHVGQAGWDQPARLFALVPTAELIAAEPSLETQLARPGGLTPDALSSIEQDGFHAGEDILDALAQITWPPAVHGVAIALERLFLPATLEAELPTDADDAAVRAAKPPVFSGRGADDQVIAADAVARTDTWLASQVTATSKTYRRLGHAVNAEEVLDLAHWVADLPLA